MARNASHSSSANTKAAATKFRKDSASYRVAATKSQMSAKKTLVKLGIYTANGKLSKNYKK